jgi:excinuclease UvrABC helicase subunit UvrB
MNNALKLTPFQKTISIEYVDGLCGSGKTYALAGYIKSNVYICTKYMIITPSKELANQMSHLQNYQPENSASQYQLPKSHFFNRVERESLFLAHDPIIS